MRMCGWRGKILRQAAKERHDAWTPAQLRAPEKTIEVAGHFPEALRRSVLQTIEMGKMAITGGLGSCAGRRGFPE